VVELSDRRRAWVLAACCTVVLSRLADPKLWMMGWDIPDTAFGAGWQAYRLFTVGSVLIMLACMLVGGLLGDFFGRRRVLLLGTLVSTLAGAMAALSPSVPWFVATRTLDVAASAVAFPLTLAVVRLTFQGRERALAMLVYITVSAGAMLVALLAIVIEQLAGWRATLVVPTVAGVAGSYLAWRYVPESRARERVLRQALTAVAWSLMLLPLTLGFMTARLVGGWDNLVGRTALVVGALGLLTLVISWRGRLRAHITEHLTHRRRHLLSVMLLAEATLNFALVGYALQLYGFFSVVQGHGPIVAGLALLPMLAAVLLMARPTAILALQIDARLLIAGGLALMGVALFLTALIRPEMPYWPLILPLALFGFGYLVAQTAWTNTFMTAMPDAVVGASAGIIKATGVAGSTLSGALLGTVLLNFGQSSFERRLEDLGLSGSQVTAATDALNVVLLADAAIDRSIPPSPILEAGLLSVYHESYAVGVAVAMLVAGVVCLLTAGLVWAVLESRRPGQPSPDDEALAELV
jgi:MFS transporter, DHA2 family, multidrug resistance protein